MDKIVRVLKRICENPDGILDSIEYGNELYFRYQGHTFSVLRRTDGGHGFGDYSFYVYPDWSGSLTSLAQVQEHGVFEENGGKMVAYHSANIATDEIATLYRVVESKLYNVDRIFDDILDDDA